MFTPESVTLPLHVLVRAALPEITPESVSAPAPVPPTVRLDHSVRLLESVMELPPFWLIWGESKPLLGTNWRLVPLPPPRVMAGRELPRFTRLSWKAPVRSSVLAAAYGLVLNTNTPSMLPPAEGATPPDQLAPADQFPGAILVQVTHPTTLMVTVAAAESTVPSLALKVKLSAPL